jgi:hypothetical protein
MRKEKARFMDVLTVEKAMHLPIKDTFLRKQIQMDAQNHGSSSSDIRRAHYLCYTSRPDISSHSTAFRGHYCKTLAAKLNPIFF